MAPRKTERIMNLTICLLLARRFVDKAYIRQVIEGYHDLSDAAFERTFERDKDELRRLGVPVETGSNDPLFPDEVGYRIRRADFELPPIDFTPAEAAVLGLASRVWESATAAEPAVSAMAKLRAAGVDPDPGRVAGLTAVIGGREPAFDALWQATNDRTPVAFDYRGETRQLEPWTMTYRRGARELVGCEPKPPAQRGLKGGPARGGVFGGGSLITFSYVVVFSIQFGKGGAGDGRLGGEVKLDDGRAIGLHRPADPLPPG